MSFDPPPENYPPEEEALEQYGLHSLDGYLTYWAFHNKSVLDQIPASQRLLVQTKNISKETDRIAQFESHANTAPRKNEILEDIDEEYVSEKINYHCRSVLDRLSNETSIALDT